ncbi:Protein nrt1 ptr family 5.6 [Rhynchospora pubera]|uniref:Protein nrt1 ptr family 5.6 n=1 Tax=Rhynchospora pubera TaxID=906938 RepID=A0AAV8C211_9POAL|nr:Protein nrt1 ptr family 5.6 [Rhynchospora pubera]
MGSEETRQHEVLSPSTLKLKIKADEGEEKQNWVYDSSVDYRGNIPRRCSTGAWKAARFIIAIEFSERLSYFGLATNLIIYLMRVLHQDLKTAARTANCWQGVTTLMPLLGGFLADAYLGRFSTVLCSTLLYLAGLVLLALSQLVPSLKPCDEVSCQQVRKVHEIIFFVGMYLVSIGTGGHKPSLESFGADQFDDGEAAERKQKMSYFNWWSCALCAGVLLGVTTIVYIQDKVGWGVADIVLMCIMGFALVIFLAGRLVYRYRDPEGSPLTPMLQVAVAAVAKRHLPNPSSASQLYELTASGSTTKRLLPRTNKLKFLDKAAIIEHKDDESAFTWQKVSPWRMATITQVEETKLILAMVPIWLACLPFGMCVAQVSTLFIKQASSMDRKLSRNFELPPASVFSLAAIGMIISVTLYEKVLVPFLRKATGSERGISILKRIGIGMVFATAAMAVAAAVERKRLNSLPSSLSICWLVPQFLIMGFGDGFALVGLQEYFYDQVPDSMRSLGIALYLSVLGAASFLCSLLITVVDHLIQQTGKAGWFGKDLNTSRLDLFYTLLAGVNALNLCWYMYLASRYSYKSVQARVGTAYSDDEDDVESRDATLDRP